MKNQLERSLEPQSANNVWKPRASLSIEAQDRYWASHPLANTPVVDLVMAISKKFVNKFEFWGDVSADRLAGQRAIFIGNHQTAFESVILIALFSAITGIPTLGLARLRRPTPWRQDFMNLLSNFPDVKLPVAIQQLEWEDHQQMVNTFQECQELLKKQLVSVMVHAEGARVHHAGSPVKKISSMLIDMSLEAGVPIVPFRVAGGLPMSRPPVDLDVPFGYGKQDYYVGAPIEPAFLSRMKYAERREFILRSINELGPDLNEEVPLPPDPSFAEEVEAWMCKSGTTHEYAVLLTSLNRLPRPCEDTRRLLNGIKSGYLDLEDTPNDRWLGSLATRIFGPSGPSIRFDCPASPSSTFPTHEKAFFLAEPDPKQPQSVTRTESQ